MSRKRTKREIRRRYNQRYYRKHRKYLLATATVYQQEHGKDCYLRSQEYRCARVRLRQVCRPDLERRRQRKHRYKLLDVREKVFTGVTAAKLNLIYQKRLRELRTMFHRDVETGRPLPDGFKER